MPYKNKVCLIDADGTLFNSFPYYNIVIDSMFMPACTDLHYQDYYSDFGQTYDLKVGEPWGSIIPKLHSYLTGEDPSAEYGARLVDTFEQGFHDLVNSPSFNPQCLANEGVLDWCRNFIDGGGRLMIHSGTNQRILEAMVDACRIADLFGSFSPYDDYITATMLPLADSHELNKRNMLSHLILSDENNYGTGEERTLFVIGDTSTDVDAAASLGLPGLKIERPMNDPDLFDAERSRIAAEQGETIATIDEWFERVFF